MKWNIVKFVENVRKLRRNRFAIWWHTKAPKQWTDTISKKFIVFHLIWLRLRNACAIFVENLNMKTFKATRDKGLMQGADSPSPFVKSEPNQYAKRNNSDSEIRSQYIETWNCCHLSKWLANYVAFIWTQLVFILNTPACRPASLSLNLFAFHTITFIMKNHWNFLMIPHQIYTHRLMHTQQTSNCVIQYANLFFFCCQHLCSST